MSDLERLVKSMDSKLEQLGALALAGDADRERVGTESEESERKGLGTSGYGGIVMADGHYHVIVPAA